LGGAAPRQALQDAHGQEEAEPTGDPALTVRRKSATGHDVVQMRVMRERRSPSVQHKHEAIEPIGAGSVKTT